MTNIQTKGIIDRYVEWLRDQSVETELAGGWSSVTFPFLDRHNDYLEFFVSQTNDIVDITDEGRTLRELNQIGCDLKLRSKRREIAEGILRGLGLDTRLLNGVELTAKTDLAGFPMAIHRLILATLALDGLASVSPPNVAAIFKDDVADWLQKLNVNAEPNRKEVGRSGVTHEFDFVIPPSGDRPMRLIQALAKTDKIHTQSFTFSVIDTRQAVGANDLAKAEFYAIYDDQMSVNEKRYLAFMDNKITPIGWSHRDQHAYKLAS